MKPLYYVLFLLILSTTIFNSCDVDCTLTVYIEEITAGGVHRLETVVEGGVGVEYVWSSGSNGYNTSAIYPGFTAGVYTVTVTDENGCEASDSYTYTPPITPCDPTMTDTAGNVYPVISLGGQCWMAENLRLELGIPYVGDSASWADIRTLEQDTMALCYYMNSAEKAAEYGVLYNWYAVQNANLCPEGWHVPTWQDWQDLIDFLGGENQAGMALQDAGGFGAPMGSYRLFNGSFYPLENNAAFWTSSDLDNSVAYAYMVNDGIAVVIKAALDKNYGLSCRCVHD